MCALSPPGKANCTLMMEYAGDLPSRRKQRHRSQRAAAPSAAPAAAVPAAAPPAQPATLAAEALSATVAATTRRSSEPRPCPLRPQKASPRLALPSSSSSGDGGRSSMAATVHSLRRSLRRCSLGSAQAAHKDSRHSKGLNIAASSMMSQPQSAASDAIAGGSSMPSQALSAGASEAPASPHTPVTDAASHLDAMSMSADAPAPPLLQACAANDRSPLAEAAAEQPATAAQLMPPLHGAPGQPQQQPQEAVHPASPTLQQRLPSGCSVPSPGLPPRTPLSSSANLPGLGTGNASGPRDSQSRSARRRRPRRSSSGAGNATAADAAAGLRTPPSSRQRRRQQLQQCATHPLDGTPQSLVRHPLQRAWPSSGRMRTASIDDDLRSRLPVCCHQSCIATMLQAIAVGLRINLYVWRSSG